MIVHVFKADLTFHCVGMIRNMIDFSKEAHYFILYIKDVEHKNEYIKLFKEKQFTNFFFCEDYTGKVSFLYRTINLLKKDKISLIDENLIKILYRERKSPIVFHGFLYSVINILFLLSGCCQNVSWINWGGYVSIGDGKKIFSFRKQKRINWIKYLTLCLYRRFNRVISLLTDDEYQLRKLGVRDVQTLSYMSDVLDYSNKDILSCREESTTGLHILVGNNCNKIPDYEKIVDLFAEQTKMFCTLEFMLNYAGEDKPEEIEKFINNGNRKLGSKFVPWQGIVDIQTYTEHLKTIDVYICNHYQQTGLGAIYFLLLFGKEIYLAGYNYTWIMELGFKVFNLTELNVFDENLGMKLSLADKENNFSLCHKIFSKSEVSYKWDCWYKSLYKQDGRN